MLPIIIDNTGIICYHKIASYDSHDNCASVKPLIYILTKDTWRMLITTIIYFISYPGNENYS